ncbi:MAG: hypothetical protein HY368_01320, partial [Candidatus Aenigmarchaeota archaeon]|nr:hypothetical protein [Candidatus Aenigmarchaeota archaeon]
MYELFEKHWKPLMLFTIVLLIISAGVLANNLVTKGSILERDVELSGGKMITVAVKEADVDAIRKELPQASVHLASGATKNLLVEIPFDGDESQAVAVIRKHAEVLGEPSMRTVGP